MNWLRRIVAVAGLVLVAATWRLWTPQEVFPLVPLFGWARGVPAAVDWCGLALLIIGLVLALAAPAPRREWRAGLLLFVLATAGLVILNQHRGQPWAYQLSLAAVVLALAPADRAIRLFRILIISVYFWSALSKLDRSFFESYGQYLVSGLMANFGIEMEDWPETARIAAAALLPAGELLVAAGLCFSRTRRAALVLSIVMHLLLIATLGPWGLNHRPGVLLWNAYFIAQNLILFSRRTTPMVPSAETASTWRGRTATAIVAAAVLLPVLEPWGLFDVWPSWGVYASRPGRVSVFVEESARERLPPSIQPYIAAPAPLDSWCRIRIDRWALDAVAAPTPPQERFAIGVALALAERHNLGESLRLTIESPADRWTGRRTSRTFVGVDGINAAARRFRLNAHPRPSH